MTKAKDFKFCTLVAPMKYYRMDDKMSLKVALSWSLDHFLQRDTIVCLSVSVCLYQSA